MQMEEFTEDKALIEHLTSASRGPPLPLSRQGDHHEPLTCHQQGNNMFSLRENNGVPKSCILFAPSEGPGRGRQNLCSTQNRAIIPPLKPEGDLEPPRRQQLPLRSQRAQRPPSGWDIRELQGWGSHHPKRPALKPLSHNNCRPRLLEVIFRQTARPFKRQKPSRVSPQAPRGYKGKASERRCHSTKFNEWNFKTDFRFAENREDRKEGVK